MTHTTTAQPVADSRLTDEQIRQLATDIDLVTNLGDTRPGKDMTLVTAFARAIESTVLARSVPSPTLQPRDMSEARRMIAQLEGALADAQSVPKPSVPCAGAKRNTHLLAAKP